MKKLSLLILLLAFFVSSAHAAEITLLKRTIQITPRRFLRYWKDPKAAEPVYNTYSWVPKIEFEVLGPIQGGSKIYVEFDKPDGKPWMTLDMRTPALDEDVWEAIKADYPNDDVLEKQAILDPGTVKFRIKMKNASGGAGPVLFAGSFKVGTYLLDQKIPDYKNKKDYFVDYDWHLPMAYLWLNPISDEEVPQLSAQVCLRGAADSAKLEALLFYNGKQVSKVAGSSYSQKQVFTSGADEPSHRWAIWEFTFATVRGFNNSSSANNYSGMFFLDKNPGEYEIRVMRDALVSRSIRFTVGSDGKIVDNGVAKNAKLGGVRMIVPAKIGGTADGPYNAAAWQTEALFGNPLVGFTP
jgi:hypothetical protein